MKNVLQLLSALFLSSFAIVVYAQQTNDDRYKNIPSNLYEQKDKYDAGEYLFPPRPKNNWSIGVKGGYAFISGDVSAQPGYGLAFDVRKALGHAFSLRFQAGYGVTRGLSYKRAIGYSKTDFNNPWKSLYEPENGGNFPLVFYNFRMRYLDAGIQGLFNINNVNFYREQSNWSIYLGAGVGLMGYHTSLDALDANGNPYDFTVISGLNNDPSNPAVEGRRETLDALKSLLDGEYETRAESHSDEEGLSLGNDTLTINPMVSLAFGIRYRLGRRVELEIEHRVGITNDDLLDGQRWQETGTLTRDFDIYNHTTLGLHFRLGKGEESLWWSNPLTNIYSDVKDAKDIVSRFTDDMDNDGIPDLYDKEPDTPEGMPVDVQGRTLDSDGDGFPDHVDDQPYTPRGCEVDSRGVALDSDEDGVPDCYDKEPGSPPGALVDAKGITINMTELSNGQGGGAVADQPCVLPIIYFDLGRDNIKPDFYPELYYVAQLMKSNPGLKIIATGHADIRAGSDLNVDLSQRRVSNAVNFLVETYGIDPGRFEVEYKGEAENQIPGLPENYNQKMEPLHTVNRRVEFDCIN